MHLRCCPNFTEKIIVCDNILNSDASVMVKQFISIYLLILKLSQVIFKRH